MTKRLADVAWFLEDDEGKVHPKRIDEDLYLSFNFAKRLASGDSINAATWTATVHAGTDASPQSIVSGSAANANGISKQKIIDGLEGVTYLLECEVTTANGWKMHGVGLLYVSDQVR